MSDPRHCADCGCELHEFNGAIIKACSVKYGIYYEGDEICDSCKKIRYENHIVGNEEKKPEAL